MAGMIGGQIGDILASSQQANSAGDASAQTAADTQGLVARMQDEVEAVSNEMERAYGDLALSLRETVQRTSEQLHGADWQGRSREALVAFDNDLNATLNRFMDSSQEGMTGFRSELMNFITSYYEVIRGEYTNAMTEIQGRYADASRAGATFAQDLENLDEQSIRY